MELVRGRVKVAWTELGEGWDGDYDDEDPEDEALLRFDVLYLVKEGETFPWHVDAEGTSDEDQWVAMRDASYCTRFPVASTPEQQAKALALIMSEIYEPASEGTSIKKICERLSWIEPSWVEDPARVYTR